MHFKTIDEAIEYLVLHKKAGDSRALRTISFDTSVVQSADSIISSILNSMIDFKDEPDAVGQQLVLDPGSYEALVIVHIRKVDPIANLPQSGSSTRHLN